MKKINRFLAILLGITMITGNLTGCGISKSADDLSNIETEQAHQTTDDENEVIKVAISGQPSLHSLGLFVAKDKGWFLEEGLDVEIETYMVGASQLEGLYFESWSVGIMGMPAGSTGAVSYDLSYLGFSTADNAGVITLARKDSDLVQAGKGHIEGYEEIYGIPELWKGKTILCTKGTMGHLQIISTLQALGLTEEDVNIVHMEVGDAYQAFQAGQGDMVCVWSTYSFDESIQQNEYVTVSSADAVDMYSPSVIVATPEAMENKEVTQKLLNVILRGILWIPEHQEEAARYYRNVCMEEGIILSQEVSKRMVVEAETLTLKEYKDLFEDNGYENALDELMKYFIAGGIWTEEDAKTVVNAFEGEMLKEAIQNYEENYMGDEPV